jgi:hypothetical protein
MDVAHILAWRLHPVICHMKPALADQIGTIDN